MKSKSVLKVFSFLFLLLESTNSFSQTSNTPNRKDAVSFSNFVTSKTDTIPIELKLNLIYFFKVPECLSGSIYFIGDGFFNAITLQCNDNEQKLKRCLENCIPGSKIILDNCAFTRDGGLKPIVINKTIVFK